MKVVVLYSGGLDSSLALKITEEWNAEIFPLYIYHKFLSSKEHPKIPNLKVLDVTEEFIALVRSPKHGYGKNLNPCIDCRILMLKKAKAYMEEINADFIVTGEVLDQRPMSQHYEQIMLIEKEAKLDGLIVRPLSGDLFPPTIPEQKGMIDRNLLLKIKGRSRKLSLALAEKMHITNYSSPGGGCLLTDPGFCRRLADLLRSKEEIELRDIELLKIGRHFRLGPETKLIVGRNETENDEIEQISKPEEFLIYVPDTGSPNALLLGTKKYLKQAASITARYSDKKDDPVIEVYFKHKGKVNKIKVTALSNEEIARWRI